MDKDSNLFRSIPGNTIRAARALYGSGNVYLRLGDRLNQLAAKFHCRNLSSHLGETQEALLTLMTVIQYVEKMTDSELADAIHLRMDLRYALHMATPSPRIDPRSLCAFRQRIMKDSHCHCFFEEVFKTVYPEITSTAMKDEPAIDDVLQTICDNEVRASLMEAMLNAMEALSATHFEWLRGIALPHWYQRYNRFWVFASLDGSIRRPGVTPEELWGDIQHLLYEIRNASSPELMETSELKSLSFLWEQLADPHSLKDCNYCVHSIH